MAELLKADGRRSEGTANKYTDIIWRCALDRCGNIEFDGRAIRTWSWLKNADALMDWIEGMDLSKSTQGLYTSALLAMAEAAGHEDTATELREHLSELRRDISREASQGLEGKEIGRWIEPHLIFRNAELLARISEKYPDNALYHYRALAYDLFTTMHSTMVFRLDVLSSRLYEMDPGAVERLARDLRMGKIISGIDTDENAFYTDGAYAILYHVKYKTLKTYGPQVIDLPSEYAHKLMDSLERFPRTSFVPMTSDNTRTLSRERAVQFVKEAWVLDAKKPVMDDIRSSLATFFFTKNLDIASRDAFARKSMSSRPTMEQHYFKTDPEILQNITSERTKPSEEEIDRVMGSFGPRTRKNKKN